MSSRALGILGYCLLLAVLLAVAAIARRPGAPTATGGRLVASVRSRRAGRIVLVLVWWWVGWHVFVR